MSDDIYNQPAVLVPINDAFSLTAVGDIRNTLIISQVRVGEPNRTIYAWFLNQTNLTCRTRTYCNTNPTSPLENPIPGNAS